MPEKIEFDPALPLLDGAGERVVSDVDHIRMTEALADFRSRMEAERTPAERSDVAAFLEARRDKRAAPGACTAEDVISTARFCREAAQSKSPAHTDLVGMSATYFPPAHPDTPSRVTTRVIGLHLVWEKSGISLCGISKGIVTGAEKGRLSFSHPLGVVRAILAQALRGNVRFIDLPGGQSIHVNQAHTAAGVTNELSAKDAATLRMIGEIELMTRSSPPSPVQAEGLSEDEIIERLREADLLAQRAKDIRASLQTALGNPPSSDPHDAKWISWE